MAGFITDHLDEIVSEWETFARALSPASDTMDSLALRDHAKQMHRIEMFWHLSQYLAI
jgi:hypothetical protein